MCSSLYPFILRFRPSQSCVITFREIRKTHLQVFVHSRRLSCRVVRESKLYRVMGKQGTYVAHCVCKQVYVCIVCQIPGKIYESFAFLSKLTKLQGFSRCFQANTCNRYLRIYFLLVGSNLSSIFGSSRPLTESLIKYSRIFKKQDESFQIHIDQVMRMDGYG